MALMRLFMQSYASEFLTLGIFYSEFADSIKEGDGYTFYTAGNT